MPQVIPNAAMPAPAHNQERAEHIARRFLTFSDIFAQRPS